MTEEKIKVGLLMGSASDKERMLDANKILEEYKIPYAMRIVSAHRTPELVDKTIAEFLDRGCEVFICGAGWAAHLAGAVAGKTICPVIGVPLASSKMNNGLDALFSTVQMPPGIPVATVGIDCSANAAYLAMQILALNDEQTREKLNAHRLRIERKIAAANRDL